ncbi:MAG: indolepyruvate oxidoreductase subunit beta [Desulfurococcaceae archaeon]
MKRVVNILIASVGGQGGVTLSRVIALASTLVGYSVKTAETLGMSQRYGSVMSYVRIGVNTDVHSPLFGPGGADYLLGLELSETLRRLHYTASSGILIVADEYRPSYTQSVRYSSVKTSDLVNKLLSLRPGVFIVPARKLAEQAGSVRALNMIILGAFNAISGLLSPNSVERAITELLPEKAATISIRAHELGYKHAQQAR